MKRMLSAGDLNRIREAVAAAERKTSGEIVPYVVRKCEEYSVAVWRAAGLGALAAFAVLTLLTVFHSGWGEGWWRDARFQTLAMAVVGTAMGVLAAFVPAVKRLFAGKQHLTRAAHRRAMAAFVEKEVFSTRERTGILLFVALFEHRIEVVGDTGINAKVSQDEWDSVVAKMRAGIKSGKLADGMVEGIHQCGELLHHSGVEIRPDDINELSDDVTFGE